MLIMASGPDQVNELKVLDGNVSTDSSQVEMTVQLEYFDHLVLG